jgi:hypothetical protein
MDASQLERERAEFEAAIAANCDPDRLAEALWRDAAGNYEAYATLLAWCVWQARAQQASAEPVADVIECGPLNCYGHHNVRATADRAIQPGTLLYTSPPPTAPAELIAAAKAVVERWDTPLWKDVPHTAEYINRLRAAIPGAVPADVMADAFIAGFVCAGGDADEAKRQAPQFQSCVDAAKCGASVDVKGMRPAERDCCGTLPGSAHRSTCATTQKGKQ